jgi:hypothetical protein
MSIVSSRLSRRARRLLTKPNRSLGQNDYEPGAWRRAWHPKGKKPSRNSVRQGLGEGLQRALAARISSRDLTYGAASFKLPVDIFPGADPVQQMADSLTLGHLIRDSLYLQTCRHLIALKVPEQNIQ